MSDLESKEVYPNWIIELKGVCVCLNDINDIKRVCDDNRDCSNKLLRDVLTSTEPPNKAKLLKALFFSGGYEFRQICSIIRAVYGPATTESVTQRIHDVTQEMKAEGYIVYKSNNSYKVRRRQHCVSNGEEGIRSK